MATTLALGGQQAGKLLVRHNGRPQLVSNVCRHRQAQMLTGCGHVKNIVCPLHNWAYDLNGRQVAAPHFEENPCLDLERTELREWNGMLFAGPRDVRHELAPLAGWTELSTSNYVLERIDEEEHDLNWKVFLEVYLEDYHISVVPSGLPGDGRSDRLARRACRPWAASDSSASKSMSAGRCRRPARRCLPSIRRC